MKFFLKIPWPEFHQFIIPPEYFYQIYSFIWGSLEARAKPSYTSSEPANHTRPSVICRLLAQKKILEQESPSSAVTQTLQEDVYIPNNEGIHIFFKVDFNFYNFVFYQSRKVYWSPKKSLKFKQILTRLITNGMQEN